MFTPPQFAYGRVVVVVVVVVVCFVVFFFVLVFVNACTIARSVLVRALAVLKPNCIISLACFNNNKQQRRRRRQPRQRECTLKLNFELCQLPQVTVEVRALPDTARRRMRAGVVCS